MLRFLRRPSRADIAHHQKLLAMYRALLAEFLRQRAMWDRTEIPPILRTEISLMRRHIMTVKGTLRGWKISVPDHPDDEGPDDDIADEVAHQRKLLQAHRRNLSIYLQQQQQSDTRPISASTLNSVHHARSEIQRIKAILRGWNVPVDDLPEEEADS